MTDQERIAEIRETMDLLNTQMDVAYADGLEVTLHYSEPDSGEPGQIQLIHACRNYQT